MSAYRVHMFSAHIIAFLNVKALANAFNQERVLVGTFYLIVKTSRTFD